MFVRPRYHRLALTLGIFELLFGLCVVRYGTDHFMAPFYLVSGAFLLMLWSNSFDVLTDEAIERRRFVFRRTIYIDDIASIEPHRKNERWSYGKVFVVVEHSGRRTNFQSTEADKFLSKIQSRILIAHQDQN